jgi:hypothetical protein
MAHRTLFYRRARCASRGVGASHRTVIQCFTVNISLSGKAMFTVEHLLRGAPQPTNTNASCKAVALPGCRSSVESAGSSPSASSGR